MIFWSNSVKVVTFININTFMVILSILLKNKIFRCPSAWLEIKSLSKGSGIIVENELIRFDKVTLSHTIVVGHCRHDVEA